MTDLEAAIDRLERAAAIWFNQDLHRDLRVLIAAARDGDSRRVAIAAAVAMARGEDPRRAAFREKAE